MKRFLTLLALLTAALCSPAHAVSFQGPLLETVTCSKVRYLPAANQTATCVVTVGNYIGATWSGNINLAVNLNGQAVASPASVTVTALAPAAMTTASFSFSLPATDHRGYHIDVTATAATGGAVQDQASGMLEVASDIVRFPREGWLSHWDSGQNIAANVGALQQHGVNIVQLYSAYYRPEQSAPPAGTPCWPSLPQLQVCASQITAAVQAAHAAGMQAYFFNGSNEAYSDWPLKLDGPTLSMGSFRRPCSLAAPCTEADLDRSPELTDTPNNWTGFGWAADHLDLFDICNPRWRKLMSQSFAGAIAAYGADGAEIDTLGQPGPTYDSFGNPLNPTACIAQTVNSFLAGNPGKGAVINSVSGFGATDQAFSSASTFLNAELWGYSFEDPKYSSIDYFVNGIPYGMRHYSARGINNRAYMNRTLDANCANKALCYESIPSLVLADMNWGMSGAYHMEWADQNACPLSNVFVEGSQLNCNVTGQALLVDVADWLVGFENVMRDGVSTDVLPIQITSGATAATTDTPGQVYVRSKTKSGFQIADFLNLTGVPSNAWPDLSASYPTPTTLTNVAVKMYARETPSRSNRLWCSAPDIAHGQAQTMSYTSGSDSSGTYVSFTIPQLTYGMLCALELNGIVDAQLHVDPSVSTILGTNYNDASPGVSAEYTVADDGCCHRWAKYEGLSFPASLGHVSITYGAATTAGVEMHTDAANGPLVGTCQLGGTNGAGNQATQTCTAYPPAGVHDLYLVYTGAPVSIYSFKFGS